HTVHSILGLITLLRLWRITEIINDKIFNLFKSRKRLPILKVRRQENFIKKLKLIIDALKKIMR
ncbi:hypothetical protein BpHYR1_002159, partial [Brachionus plicatilis]